MRVKNPGIGTENIAKVSVTVTNPSCNNMLSVMIPVTFLLLYIVKDKGNGAKTTLEGS